MNGRPWKQADDGVVLPVHEDMLFLDTPIFQQLMRDRLLDYLFPRESES